ncbi:glycoside hydrolase family 99-like domain-containing protein [Maricaulis sp.]|uniref:glycoside hydrolase family 99-like domain-containing protein n=1 Tax=Maricaulis sp. TaxID=1486257 RepID=UPI00262D3A6B|nr:glycoside hydrolase family 99-like domain-containing protein [Maricaulis sp.]MDF1769362.1 glycoside hydrolase family 99-like domain-containing protein [Maricaulis sp.]
MKFSLEALRKKSPRNLRFYSRLFDAQYYRSKITDIIGHDAAAVEDLLNHYLDEGWKLGCDPSADFGGKHYLDNNPEVKIAGVNPLTHFLTFGEKEGRAYYRVDWKPWQPATYPKDSPLIALEALFDRDFYLAIYGDIRALNIDPLAHYVAGGWKEGRDPAPWFSTSAFLADHSNAAQHERAPLLFMLDSDAPSRDEIAPSTADPVNPDDKSMIASHFDADFYKDQAGHLFSKDETAIGHFLVRGWHQGFDPSPDFSVDAYLSSNRDVAELHINPFLHYLEIGSDEGREPEPSSRAIPRGAGNQDADKSADAHQGASGAAGSAAGPDQIFRGELHAYLKSVVEPQFDADFYIATYGATIPAAADPLDDYLIRGWKVACDPCPGFSVEGYLLDSPDIRDAGIEPFSHYLNQGKHEGRIAKPSRAIQARSDAAAIFEGHKASTEPGPDFEPPRPEIFAPHRSKAKALAFYLPQFHVFEENNEWWGTGFTEWTKITHGMPRFAGHRQPRIPRDLGFYDLTDVKNLRAQAELAKAYGVYGFAIYYYFFNGKRLMERPLDILLENTDIDLPFCLIWANENWTRTWDGFDRNVLISQDYRDEHEDDLLADWQRHFSDERYIRINGRPLIVIYRPGIVPDCKTTVMRWRRKMESKYGERPYFMMAQGFGDTDPREFGLDAAIEFPPHKVLAGVEPINTSLDIYDPDFTGSVFDYQSLITRSCAEPAPDYPLIKTATLGWDNEARRPGRGMTITNFTPELYEQWLGDLVRFADSNRIENEAFIGINAWNEWAEGVYLEPDTYYGHALLNATARALSPPAGRDKILVVGHDAHRHGAQVLLLNLLKTLKNGLGFDVASLILGPGVMVEDYGRLGAVFTTVRQDPDAIRKAVYELREAGFTKAITNTTVSGAAAGILKEAGFSIVSLVHELPQLIEDYNLHFEADSIAKHADCVVFPGKRVRNGFDSLTSDIQGAVIERPQGLYSEALLDRKSVQPLHEILDVPETSKIVLNMAFGDSRKGFDLFLKTAERMIAKRDDVVFVWAGNVTPDIERWILPDLKDRSLSKQIIVTDYVDDLEPYYRGAHVFYLSSREDPFPSVVLEALAAGLPIVGFENVGDCEPLIAKHGTVIPRADIGAAAEALGKALDRAPSTAKKAKVSARRQIREKFSFKDYALSLTEALNPRQKRVSVVVPNYNYEEHIEARLASIFEQTYPIYEIIVLDDKSSDDSLARIKAVARRYNRDIKLIVNKTNSGSVFKQWDKGARLAKGDYVWIAEADDVADPRFLEGLMVKAAERDFSLAFSDSWQMDEKDTPLSDTYKPYCGAYTDNLFDDRFRMGGPAFLRECLSVRNVILNVSSAVWSKVCLVDALDNVGNSLLNFRVAGDWRLYMEICKSADSEIVYVPEALNGHRRHSTSVTHALNPVQHIKEIADMQSLANEFIELPHKIKNRQAEAMEEVEAHFANLDQNRTSN